MSPSRGLDRDDFLPGMYDGKLDPAFDLALAESGLTLENRGSIPPSVYDFQPDNGAPPVPLVAFAHPPGCLTLVSPKPLMPGQTATVTRRVLQGQAREALLGTVDACRPGQRAHETDPFFIVTFTLTHGTL
ncbi:MAG: hypothetical protein ACOZAQ_00805 [Pseudomonadota bacterium]